VKLCVPLGATVAVVGATATVIPPLVLAPPPHPLNNPIPATEIAAPSKNPNTRRADVRIT
jgi:hypothetical protein